MVLNLPKRRLRNSSASGVTGTSTCGVGCGVCSGAVELDSVWSIFMGSPDLSCESFSVSILSFF